MVRHRDEPHLCVLEYIERECTSMTEIDLRVAISVALAGLRGEAQPTAARIAARTSSAPGLITSSFERLDCAGVLRQIDELSRGRSSVSDSDFDVADASDEARRHESCGWPADVEWRANVSVVIAERAVAAAHLAVENGLDDAAMADVVRRHTADAVVEVLSREDRL